MIIWAYPSPQRKRHLDCLAAFEQMTAKCPYTLQWFAHFPIKIAPSHEGSEPPSNTWFLGSTGVLNANGISVAPAVFAGLTNVTDRQTDG